MMHLVHEYCVSQRQWKREHRMSHAQYQFTLADTTDRKKFWRLVLDRLQRPEDKKKKNG